MFSHQRFRLAITNSFSKVTFCLVLIVVAPLFAIVSVVTYYFLDPKSLRQFAAPSVAGFTPFWAIWHNARGRRYLAVEDAHRRLGPVIRIGPNSLSFSDPRAYKDIYGHGSSIIKDIFYDNLAGDTPSMADTSSRRVHSIKRKNVSNIFSAKNISTMEPKVVQVVETLLRAIDIKAAGGRVSEKDTYPVSRDMEFDLRPWMNMFSFDAFSSMLWSMPYGFLTLGNDLCKSMDAAGQVKSVQAMDSFQTGVHFNTLCAQLSPPVYGFSRWATRWMGRNQAADKFTGMARYGTVQRLKNGPKGTDFFTFFPLEATEKRPVPMSVPDIVAECTSFLNAGKPSWMQSETKNRTKYATGNDTTQISLTNTMFQLATHPASQQKLYSLLTESLDEEAQPIAPFADLSKIPFLAACLDETLRIMPPVRFGLPRRTVGEGSIIQGHAIPGHVTVSASVQTMHRDETLFRRASAWVPERWIPGSDDSSEQELRNLREFVLPFTLGGRACIGRNLAYMEMSICLAALVMAFEWKITDKERQQFTHFERFNSSPLGLMVSAVPRRPAKA